MMSYSFLVIQVPIQFARLIINTNWLTIILFSWLGNQVGLKMADSVGWYSLSCQTVPIITHLSFLFIVINLFHDRLLAWFQIETFMIQMNSKEGMKCSHQGLLFNTTLASMKWITNCRVNSWILYFSFHLSIIHFQVFYQYCSSILNIDPTQQDQFPETIRNFKAFFQTTAGSQKYRFTFVF